MEPVSSRCAEILLYLKISISRQNLFFSFWLSPSAILSFGAGNMRHTSWDSSRWRRACNIRNQKTLAHARTLRKEAAAPLLPFTCQSYFKWRQRRTWCYSSVHWAVLQLSSFHRRESENSNSAAVTCVTATVTPRVNLGAMTLTYSNCNAKWVEAHFSCFVFSLNPRFWFSLPDCCLPPPFEKRETLQLLLGQCSKMIY